MSPQRVPSDTAVLMAQFTSPVGAPHLGQVLQPQAVTGSRRDAPPPEPRTTPVRVVRVRAGPGAGRADGAADPVAARGLPATGGASASGVAGAALVTAAALAARRGHPET